LLPAQLSVHFMGVGIDKPAKGFKIKLQHVKQPKITVVSV